MSLPSLYKDTYKGRFAPTNPRKYVGDLNNIVYRSSWELKFMKYCDNNPAVVKWSSEEIRIPYRSPIDNQVHNYYVDFFMEVKTTDGSVKKMLVEIKPKKFTMPPVQPKRKTKRYIAEVFEWGKNDAKWKSAREWCHKRGWEFMILTEDHLHI